MSKTETYYEVHYIPSCGEDFCISSEETQKEAEVIFLIELNNTGGYYKLIECQKTVEHTRKQKITTTIETVIDMTEKIKDYKNNFGGLISEGRGNPQINGA